MAVQWYEEEDDNGNTIWEAASPYHDEGVPFYWRLKQELRFNRIVWVADHTEELKGDGEVWNTLEEAKASIEKGHAEILKQEGIVEE